MINFPAMEFGIRTVERPSAVNLVADALREEIFRQRESDRFIGFEEDLIGRLGVSRPTFRQAIRLLKHEQLIRSKRGSRGGFYTCRPNVDAVSHLAGVYLIFAGATLADITRASAPLYVSAARRIAANPDPNVRSALWRFVEKHDKFESVTGRANKLLVINGFKSLVATLCDAKTIQLFLETERHLTTETRVSVEYPMEGSLWTAHTTYMKDLARAVEKGDGELSARIVEKHLDDLSHRQS